MTPEPRSAGSGIKGHLCFFKTSPTSKINPNTEMIQCQHHTKTFTKSLIIHWGGLPPSAKRLGGELQPPSHQKRVELQLQVRKELRVEPLLLHGIKQLIWRWGVSGRRSQGRRASTDVSIKESWFLVSRLWEACAPLSRVVVPWRSIRTRSSSPRFSLNGTTHLNLQEVFVKLQKWIQNVWLPVWSGVWLQEAFWWISCT